MSNVIPINSNDDAAMNTIAQAMMMQANTAQQSATGTFTTRMMPHEEPKTGFLATVYPTKAFYHRLFGAKDHEIHEYVSSVGEIDSKGNQTETSLSTIKSHYRQARHKRWSWWIGFLVVMAILLIIFYFFSKSDKEAEGANIGVSGLGSAGNLAGNAATGVTAAGAHGANKAKAAIGNSKIVLYIGLGLLALAGVCYGIKSNMLDSWVDEKWRDLSSDGRYKTAPVSQIAAEADKDEAAYERRNARRSNNTGASAFTGATLGSALGSFAGDALGKALD